MKGLIERIASVSGHIITLIILIVLVIGQVALQLFPWDLPFLESTFKIMVLFVLLNILGLSILIRSDINMIRKPNGLSYIVRPQLPSPSDTAKRVGATSVIMSATSLGRTKNYISDLLDNTNVNIYLFCSPPRLPFLVESQINESIGQLSHFLLLNENNPRLKICITNNPINLGFVAFTDKKKTIKICFIHWYTFMNGFLTQRGRGINGTLVAEKGSSEDADALLLKIQEMIDEKKNDSSLRELRTMNDLNEVSKDKVKCKTCSAFSQDNKKLA